MAAVRTIVKCAGAEVTAVWTSDARASPKSMAGNAATATSAVNQIAYRVAALEREKKRSAMAVKPKIASPCQQALKSALTA
jgi:hypothetical protein